MTKLSSLVLWVSFTVLCVASTVAAQTTEFTYQGSLKDGAAAANANYDFEFAMFDALSSGNQIGATIPKSGVVVSNGIFSVKLDFGSVFPGAGRYLEIHVRLAGQPGFTTLTPRQLVNSAPYSVKSLNTDNAATATNSTQLGGVAANQYVVTTDPRMTDARSPTSGSPDYVQNSTSQQSSSNFNIAGIGKSNVFDAATAYNIRGLRMFSAPNNSSNLAVGLGAGQAISTGISNSFFGNNAGSATTTGFYNSFFGEGAGAGNTATGNSFFGFNSGYNNSSATNNAFFGYGSGRNTDIGGFNSFFGSDAGQENITGVGNSFFGYAAGSANTTGSYNTFLGIYAGSANASGSGNTLIGFNSEAGANNLNNATAIGLDTRVDCSNCLVLGSINGVNSATSDTKVGIGTTAPNAALHLKSSSVTGFAIQLENTSTTKRLYLGNYGTTGGGVHWPGMDSANTSFLYAENPLVFNTSGGIFFSGSTTAEHMRIAVNGNVGIGTTSPAARLDINGNLRIAVLPAGGSVNLCLNNSSFLVSTCSSSLRYKTNIGNFQTGISVINRLKPITFDWKEGGMHDLGFGAEDVAAVEPLLVTYNKDGQVEGVKYDRIGVVLVNAVKEQQGQIEALQIQIKNQQKQIESFKALVCAQNPTAVICKKD